MNGLSADKEDDYYEDPFEYRPRPNLKKPKGNSMELYRVTIKRETTEVMLLKANSKEEAILESYEGSEAQEHYKEERTVKAELVYNE